MDKRKVFSVIIRLNAAENELMRRGMKRTGLSVSDYLRSAVLMDGVLSGDVGALKIIGGHMRSAVTERLQSLHGLREADA
jgi:hypothetical protein